MTKTSYWQKQITSNTIVDFTINGATGGIIIPSGNSTQRPPTPADGTFRLNTTLAQVEIYQLGSWSTLANTTTIGEINTASNIGTGNGMFAGKVGLDFTFKTLVAGTNTTIGITGTELIINSKRILDYPPIATISNSDSLGIWDASAGMQTKATISSLFGSTGGSTSLIDPTTITTFQANTLWFGGNPYWWNGTTYAINGATSAALPTTGGTMTGSITMTNPASVLANPFSTSTLPAYSFNTDSNTGMYRSGPDTLSLATGGVAALTIGASRNATFSAGLTVAGNLNVLGTTTTINSSTLAVVDNIITLNSGEIGAGISLGSGGIDISRGTLPDALLIFNEVTNLWEIGTVGSTQNVWSGGYQGTGTGMDSDLLDGLHAVSFSLVANNLSDLVSIPTARTNLGLVSGGLGDIWVKRLGDTMTGTLNMGNQILTSPLAPTLGTHVGDRAYNDIRYVNTTGDTMTGSLSFGIGARLLNSGGSVTAPTISFASDLTTGLYSTGAGILGLAAGGTNIVTTQVGGGTNASVVITTTDAISIPSGNTLQRPTVPVNGMLRYNSTLSKLEGYIGGWKTIDTGGLGLIASNNLSDLISIPTARTNLGLVSGGLGDIWVKRLGDTMTGTLNMGGQILTSPLAPTLGAHVGDRAYNDTRYVNTLGDTMTGTLNMGNQILTSPLAPTLGTHVGDRAYNDNRYVNTLGDTMTGTLNMGGQILTSPLAPTLGTHVGDRAYNDIRYINTLGDTMTGSLSFGIGARVMNNAGTALLPAVSFSTNATTGLYSIGTNAIGVSTGGVLTTTTKSGGGLGASFIVNSTDAIQTPVGTTLQRPSAPVNGMFRYNSTLSQLEGYAGGTWKTVGLSGVGLLAANNLSGLTNVPTARTNLGLVAGGLGDIWLKRVGDTMTGSLTLGTGAQILNNTGTALLPSMSFSTNPNTGLYSITANAVGVATNGVLTTTTKAGAGISASFIVNSTDAIQTPIGTTLQRPSAPANGMIRYNSTLSQLEGYVGGIWKTVGLSGVGLLASNNLSGLTSVPTARTNLGLVAGGLGDIWVKRAGDTMTGTLNMGNQILTSPLAPTLGTHVGDRAYNDARYINTAGDTMTGSLSFGVGARLLNGAGTVTTPSVSFSTDPNTGLYSAGAGILGLTAGGTNIITTQVGGSANASVIITTTDAVSLPSGTTIQRPTLPTNGMIRYNSTSGKLEGYMGGWKNFDIGGLGLLAANNLSDLISIPTARTNLGLVSGGLGDIWVKRLGDTMTGTLNMGGQILTSPLAPTLGTHVGDRAYNDTRYVNTLGDTMTGTLNMGNQILTSPLAPTLGAHVGDRAYNDTRYVNTLGDTMTGTLNMGGQILTSPLAPTLGTHVGDRAYNDTRYINTAGDTMTGSLSFGIGARVMNNAGTVLLPAVSFLTNSTTGLYSIGTNAIGVSTGGVLTTTTKTGGGLGASFIVNSTDAIQTPIGTTLQRPSVPVNGMFRYNSTLSQLEGYVGGAWKTIGLAGVGVLASNNLSDLVSVSTARTNLGLVAGGLGDIWVKRAGDTMTGVLTMGNQILNATGTALLPAVSFSTNPNTGLYSITANAVGVATNGVLTTTTKAGAGLGASFIVNSTDAIQTPIGTTLQRPSVPANGMIRYNSTLSQIEGYAGGAWKTIGVNGVGIVAANNLSDLISIPTARTNLGLVAGGLGDIWVKRAGDTMTGTLNMGNQILTSPLAPTLGTHVGDRAYNDIRYVNTLGDTMTGTLNMGGQILASPLAPTLGTHVGDRAYNDTRYINTTGDTMTGSLSFGVGARAMNNAGTALLPAVSFTANSTTGLYSIGTNAIGVSTGGILTTTTKAGGGLGASFIVNSTDALQTPIGTTLQRPSVPVNGMFRYNSTLSQLEGYAGGAWKTIGISGVGVVAANNLSDLVSIPTARTNLGLVSGGLGDIWVKRIGDTMTGSLTLGAGAQILNNTGTALLPAVSFSTNSNTGLYSITANAIGVATNGVLTTTTKAGAGISASFIVNSTDAIQPPVGTTAQRPSAPANGMIRFNSTTGKFEGYSGLAWKNLNTPTITTGAGTGTGVLTTFATGAVGIPSVDYVEVFLDGVRQVPTTDYTLTGSNIIFVTAPANGVKVHLRTTT